MGCDFAPAKSEGRGNGHFGDGAAHRRWLGTARSAFDAGHGHGFDELFLDDEVEEEYGEDDDGRGGHDGVPALFGEGVVAGEGEGEGCELVAADDQEGVPDPVVPLGLLRTESQRSVFCAGSWWWSGRYGGWYGEDSA